MVNVVQLLAHLALDFIIVRMPVGFMSLMDSVVGRVAGLQSFCNPNARSAMGFVGTPWETGPKVSLQIATVIVTSCD